MAAHDRAGLAPITANLGFNAAAHADDRTSRDATNGYLADRAAMFTRKNLSRPELTAEEIADELGVSVRHLFQRWSTQPETLAEPLLGTRLTAARSLLTVRPLLPVNVVAHRCGFADASHYSRRFRSADGVTPTQYRRSQ
ncbi:helix-turn-helix transcriptional regulator [Streptomyces sp. NPDC002742]|uniref:helix-turn-helix transcriptional regulator n=1 Tax=Streptomyces sp. NPDC002742 TaxID=3364663 RepID=UPI0036822D9B